MRISPMSASPTTTLARALARRHSLPFVDLQVTRPDEVVLHALPEPTLRKAQAIPYELLDNVLHVAVADPVTAAELAAETSYSLAFAVAPRDQIAELLATLTRPAPAAEQIWRREEVLIDGDGGSVAAGSPAVLFVNRVLSEAIAQRASDVHFIPEEDRLLVKARVDGILTPLDETRGDEAAAVISRLKVVARLDIAEHRHAQDGRISLKTTNGRLFDARIAVLPTVTGEGAIVRLLETTRPAPTLSAVGLDNEMQMTLERLLNRAQGAMIVTGPTGSGKTTTLYAALADISRSEINVITIEDPVEYRLPGAYQVQIDSRGRTTFADTLRSVLRADPDVIMVGEIRDRETAALAVSAAMTGHRVLTTLHTNDAPTALARLSELGVDAHDLGAAINVVLAQRLVRRLCVRCREAFEPSAEELVHLGYAGEAAERGAGRFFRAGPGCAGCSRGYRGRIGIFQLLPLTPDLIGAIGSPALLERAAAEAGMRPLWSDGLRKAEAGTTSLEELRRVLAN